jgi:hypothetical protein
VLHDVPMDEALPNWFVCQSLLESRPKATSNL